MAFKLGNIQVFPHNYFFDFMKWRKVTIGISAAATLISFLILVINGLNYSIDFLGGTEIQINSKSEQVNRDALKSLVTEAGFSHSEVTAIGNLTRTDGNNAFLIRIPRETGHDETAISTKTDALVKSFSTSFGTEKVEVGSITNISGKIGREDEFKGYMALLLSCIGILLYIAFRFDARFAPGAVLCLIHNVLIALGFMTLIGSPFTTTSIAALLTIVGYSINDTVIVYDRIRETRLMQPRMPMVEVVNRSISQTMNRTILTSATSLLALIVLAVLGGGSLEDFAITMLVGIIVGTYSSIYVAAPLTLMMDKYFVRFGWFDKPAKAKEVVKQEDYAPPVFLRKKTKK